MASRSYVRVSTTCSSPAAMAITVLPVPARPSRATTLTSGSSSSSSANRCSFDRARRPHASGAEWPSTTSSSSTRRASADCEPERSTANPFSVSPRRLVDRRRRRCRPPRTARRSSRGVGLERRPSRRSRVAADRPTGWCSAASTPRCAALMRSAASLDTIVVGAICAWPSAAPMIRLSGSAGSRPCSISRCFWTPLISICSVPASSSVGDRHGCGQRPAGADPELLDRAQRGARGSTDVVGAGLQPVELLDHGQRDDDVDAAEAGEAAGIGDEHRGVEHDPACAAHWLSAVR